jgi:formimidoylglutamate deiminase
VTAGTTTFIPDLLYVGGRFRRGLGLTCDRAGRVLTLLPVDLLRQALGEEPREGKTYDISVLDHYFTTRFVRLPGRAMLPGMVNAHSHAFQRVIRGRTEYRGSSAADSFWTWRAQMYSAAARLTPEDLYDASRMAFLEMALAGITTVGEFHYLHRTADGREYDDPNLLAREVVRAARDVGLRIALLRVAYARAGYRKEPDERQRRFIEPDPATFIRHTQALIRDLAPGDARAESDAADSESAAADEVKAPWMTAEAPASAWVGVAPHSVRAVSVEYLREVERFALSAGLPVHMHVAEQPAETEACLAETGRTPVALLAEEGVLSPRFTGVHAVHVTAEEVASLGSSGACVCACPTTERNLGDGIVPADALLGAGVPVALGTDSHAQIDLLEDARELEYHLRLRTLRRNVLAPAPARARDVDKSRAEVDGGRAEENGVGAAEDEGRVMSALAARLFECASASGARSVGVPGGAFEPGRAADFFTVALDDPSIAGAAAEDLLPAIVFSLSRAAVRETAVGGRLVTEQGRHPAQDEIVSRFAALQKRLWS